VILDINPTRMELLRLRKRIVIARRGHKLLKDKQDELMRQLIDLIREIRDLRRRVERELTEASQRFLLAKAALRPGTIEGSLLVPTADLGLAVERRHIMNIRAPVFAAALTGTIHCYGYLGTSGELDASLLALQNAMKLLVELAQKEKTIQLLADEIEKTRRRVNALEYVLIPDLTDTIKYISMKLSEMERSNLSRLMRVKEIVREH
jgi:V/A-type H+-transporting ATPase subunit D